MESKYKKMIKGMLRKDKKRKKEPWFVYVLRCADASFYTGITKDLARRLKMHNNGKASRYTRTRRPVMLIYQEKAKGRAKALARECAIKAMSRKVKEKLIKKRYK